MVVATDAGDRAELDALAALPGRLGRDVERLTGRELRRLEPALGPDVRGGLSVPGDLAVDNRRAAGRAAGGRRAGRGARSCDRRGRACVEPATASRLRATARGDRRATRCWSRPGACCGGLHPALAGLVRPVKGEILRLRAPARRAAAAEPHGARAGRRPARLRGAPRRRRPGDRRHPVRGRVRHRASPSAGCATCCATPSGCCRGSPSTRWSRRRPGCARAARTTCR